jgi:SAM-dependent methyltransferase
MEGNFKDYSKYYDLLYEDKDYKGEAVYVDHLIKKYAPESKSVLEIGMGTGMHAELLKQFAFDVAGIEISPEMAAIAQMKGLDCCVADCADFDLGRRFDACISLFHVISYVTENTQLVNTFKNVHKHLNSNGIFLFDCWYTPAVYQLRPETRIKRLENDFSRVIRVAEPVMHINKNSVDVKYEIRVEDKLTNQHSAFFENHTLRHFSIPEIDVLAKHTGFELLNSEEWLTGNLPTQNSWGVVFLLKKI